VPGDAGQEGRHGVEFGTFFSHPHGATPPALLQRGVYSAIAVPLKGGVVRTTSMLLLGMALGLPNVVKVPDGVIERHHPCHRTFLCSPSLVIAPSSAGHERRTDPDPRIAGG
jgi:hypothetical protein